MSTTKEQARELIDRLPETATWEDIQYSIYVRERIERGLREVENGQILDEDEVEARMQRCLTE
jgi:predicted transcriptional regulator